MYCVSRKTRVDTATTKREHPPLNKVAPFKNQMKVRREDITLMLSKIAEGYFDVAVISAEISDAYHVEDIVYENTEIINGERF